MRTEDEIVKDILEVETFLTTTENISEQEQVDAALKLNRLLTELRFSPLSLIYRNPYA